MQLREMSLLIVLGITLLVDSKVESKEISTTNTAYYENRNKSNAWQDDYAERVRVVKPNIKFVEREVLEVIPFETITETSDTLSEGETHIKQEGIDGSLTQTYRDTIENDVVIHTELVGEIVSKVVQHEIIVVGTGIEMEEQTHVQSEGIERSNSIESDGVYRESIAYEMFDAMNLYRNSQGLSSLEWSSDLAYYANIRAQELELNFDHIRPDGSAWDSLNPSIIYAENLAMRAYRVSTAMDSFIASPTHRNNMLSEYPKAAVSVFEASDGEWYWVQLYGY